MAADDVDFAGKGQKKGFGAKVRGCCNGVYNKQKGEFLGRTGSSWAKISLFYIVFYSCLAGFFAIMLVGFFSTLDDNTPTMTNMYSLIKQNPGMGFRPMEKEKESTLIAFNTSDPETYAQKITDIVQFLEVNQYLWNNSNGLLVPNTNVTSDSDGKPLFNFKFEGFDGQCNLNATHLNESFGYKSGNPCILLKINRVINWKPEPLDPESDFGMEANASLGGVESFSNNSISVTCEGENDGDVDNLGKPVFYPEDGFSFDFYPYTNALHYRAPIVFVTFPNAEPGVVMQVWCKLWVQNIKHHKNDKGGSVHFELLIDKKKPEP
jgi:sodium/potassium-transporting ATPase subunit beta